VRTIHGDCAGLTGASLTSAAFSSTLGVAGELAVATGLALFAISTIISWSYYGDRCFQYLFGDRAVLPYRIVHTVVVPVGALAHVDLVWNLCDIADALMAVPNLVALLMSSGAVILQTEDCERCRAEGLLP